MTHYRHNDTVSDKVFVLDATGQFWQWYHPRWLEGSPSLLALGLSGILGFVLGGLLTLMRSIWNISARLARARRQAAQT